MAPTIIEKNGKPYLALGSPGGSTIPGTVLQTIVNRIDLREPLPNAIALPRAVERNTATTQAEQAFIDSPEGQSLAAARGHKFAPPAAPGRDRRRHGHRVPRQAVHRRRRAPPPRRRRGRRRQAQVAPCGRPGPLRRAGAYPWAVSLSQPSRTIVVEPVETPAAAPAPEPPPAPAQRRQLPEPAVKP